MIRRPPRGVAIRMALSTETSRLEPGSFRDPESRVFYAGDGVYRALSADGLSDFKALAATELWKRFTGDGRLVGTELLDGVADLPERSRQGQRRRAQARADPVRLVSRTSGRSRCSRTPRCCSST